MPNSFSTGYGAGGVLQYDSGKTVPPQFVLMAMSMLKEQYESDGHTIEEEIGRALTTKLRLRSKYRRPGPSSDRLYISSSKHAGSDNTDCAIVCDHTSKLVNRIQRTGDQDDPMIHFRQLRGTRRDIPERKCLAVSQADLSGILLLKEARLACRNLIIKKA